MQPKLVRWRSAATLLATRYRISARFSSEGIETVSIQSGTASPASFWKNDCPVIPSRVATQHERAVLQKWQQSVGDPVVVGDQVALGVAGLREIYFIKVAKPDPITLQLNHDILGLPPEQLGFDLGSSGDYVSHNGGRRRY